MPDDKLYHIQVQALPSGPGSGNQASPWSDSELFYAADGHPQADRRGGIGIIGTISYPFVVATVPVYGHQWKNSSGEHEFRFKICTDTIPMGVTTTAEDLANAIERWETETNGLVKATRETHTQGTKVKCFPRRGLHPSGENEIMFVDRVTINLAGCLGTPPACWRSSTWDKVATRSVRGLIWGLPMIAKGTIYLWNIPGPGDSPTDWNVPYSNGCPRLEHMVVHEAGHAFGMGWPINDHPTIQSLSVMSSGYAHHNRYCKPQLYDIVAIEANYQSR